MENTRIVNFTCKKCKGTYKLNIGNYTKEEVVENLKSWKSFECPGHHVEITNPLEYWDIDWSSTKETKVATEEEWLSSLKNKYNKVFDHNELDKEYVVRGFQMGLCIAKNKTTEEEVIFDFTRSPNGKRYYFAH